MLDYRHSTEIIREYLAAMDRAPSPQMPDAARAYADQCAETNARLRRCIDYLRHGLRSEAIELAEEQPPVLDAAAALDLPRPEDWEQACSAYGWARPQRVMMDAAREVNDAYNEQQPLTELLQRHRTLALRRAPVSERLAVIWELTGKDPRTAFWQTDARALEAVRLLDLNAINTSAMSDDNLARIDRALSELQDARWRTPIPEELKTRLQSASTAGHRRTAVARLWEMAPEVEAAVAAGGATEARRVLDKWCAIVAKGGIALPADLRQLVRPLNALVDADDARQQQVKQFRAACAELSAALEVWTDPIQLKDLYHAATGFGLPVPAKLESEYRRQLGAWEKTQQREAKRALMLNVLLLGAIAAALGTLIVVVIRSAH